MVLGHASKEAALALMMPVILLGGIYGCVFAPTEAAVVAVFYALIVGMRIYKAIKFKDLYTIFRKSVISSAVIMFIIGLNLFAVCTVAKISLDRIIRELVPFVLVVLSCLMLITYVPQISLLRFPAVRPRPWLAKWRS